MPSSFTVSQHPFQAMALQAAILQSQGSGGSSFSGSPSTQTTHRPRNPFLSAASGRNAGSGGGNTPTRLLSVSNGGGMNDMFSRSSMPNSGFGGNMGGSMTGPLHGSMSGFGSPGFSMGGPGPAPVARRRRMSLDSSVPGGGLPPLPSAPSMGSSPFTISLDLVRNILKSSGPRYRIEKLVSCHTLIGFFMTLTVFLTN